MAELTPEQETQKNKILKQRVDIAAALVAQAERLSTVESGITDATERHKKIRQEIVAQSQLENDLISSGLALTKQIENANLSIADQQKKGTTSSRQTIKELRNTLKVLNRLAGMSKEELSARVQINEAIERGVEASDRLEKKSKGISDTFAGMLGITKGWKDTIVGSLMEATNRAGSFRGAVESIKGEFGRTYTSADIAGSSLMKMQELLTIATLKLASAQDQAITQFNKSIGSAGRYSNMLVSLNANNREFGVSMQQAAAATGALYQNMEMFSKLSSTTAYDISRLTSQLELFGVQASSSAQAMQLLTAGFGMNARQAQAALANTVKLSTEIGVAPQRLVNELATLGPQLAQYGEQAQHVFNQLARSAKALNLQMGQIIGFAQQFDTFEGAARAVGRLNAIMGGPYLNAVTLMTMKEHERIRAVKEAIQVAGVQYNELGKFERQAYAAAAGIKDMAQANAILGMSLTAYDRANTKTREAVMRQEDLSRVARTNQSVMSKLSMLMESFAISMRPVVQLFSGFLTVTMKINDFFGGYLVPALTVAAGWFTALKLKAAMAALTMGTQIPAAITSVSVAAGASTGPIVLFSGAMQGMAAGGASAAAGLAPVAAVIASIGVAMAGVGVAAWGFSKLKTPEGPREEDARRFERAGRGIALLSQGLQQIAGLKTVLKEVADTIGGIVRSINTLDTAKITGLSRVATAAPAALAPVTVAAAGVQKQAAIADYTAQRVASEVAQQVNVNVHGGGGGGGRGAAPAVAQGGPIQIVLKMDSKVVERLVVNQVRAILR